MSEIKIEYKPKDFMYYSNNIKKPNCKPYSKKRECINHIDCYNMELCKNKDYADKLIEMSRIHSGSSERYLNTKDLYNKEIFNTGNLIFGIVLSCIFLYYNKDYNKITKCIKA